jgi:hypothetical protein
MAIQDDWTIDYGAKTVEHTSGTTVYTVLAFFQWLATTFAASAQMDDDYAFVSDTPTVFRWVNGWAFGAPTTDFKFLKGASIESSDGNDLWTNLYSIGDQYRSSMIYVIQNDAEVTPWWSVGNIDILIKVKSGGTLIDSGNVLVMSRDTDCLYDHNFVDLSGGGRNPVGINTFQDLNYLSTGDIRLTVADESAFDIGNYAFGNTSSATGRIQYKDAVNHYIYLVQVEGTFEAETIYERTTRNGTNGTSTSCSVVTEVIAGYDDISITFGDTSKDLNNGNGSQPYKVIIDGAGRTMLQVYQYLKYVAAHNSGTSLNSDAGEEYRSANEGVYTDVKQAPFGTFAGGTFFGARGVWIENVAAATFQLTDADGDTQTPPNYQKVTCAHDSLSGCRIFVAVRSGATVVKNQYTYDDGNSDATHLAVNEAININRTPISGIIRIGDTQYTYTSFDSATKKFIVASDPTGETNGANCYVPLMDVLADATSEETANLIYSTDIPVKVRVRKYGYKDFTLDTTFGSGGLAIVPILQTDPQAS